jgi:hypothetical protein
MGPVAIGQQQDVHGRREGTAIPPRIELLFPLVPRLATLTAALVLALPGAAMAQGAGDDQYQDPFGEEAAQQQGGSGSGGGGGEAQSAQGGGLSDEPPVSGSSGSGSGSDSAGQAGATTTPAAPEQPAPATGAAEQATDQLPNTGSDPRALLLCGLAFVLIGVGLRLRTIDPDAY